MTAVEWATTVPFPLCRRHLFFETRWQKFYEFLTQVMARFELPNRMSRLDALHTRVLVAVLGHLRIWQFPRINLTRCTAVLGSEIPFAEACHDGRLLKGDQPQKAIMASFTAGKNHVSENMATFSSPIPLGTEGAGQDLYLASNIVVCASIGICRAREGSTRGVSQCLSVVQHNVHPRNPLRRRAF